MWDRVYEVDTSQQLLRLRETASEASPILARLEPGQIVCRLDSAVYEDRWWAVFADLGQAAYVGFVQAEFLQPLRPVSGALEPAPVDTIPASPATPPSPPVSPPAAPPAPVVAPPEPDGLPVTDTSLPPLDPTHSYRSKIFTIVDRDARLRNAEDLGEYLRVTPGSPPPEGWSRGVFLIIPPGTRVKIDDVRVISAGMADAGVYAHVSDVDTGEPIGWTSRVNFDGKMIGETVGLKEPEGGDEHGPEAAWSAGEYLGQVQLVQIVSYNGTIKFITLDTAKPLLDMVDAAARADVPVYVNSGFRSYPEQKYFYDRWQSDPGRYPRAAAPGRSKHQSGIAVDFVVGRNGDPVYEWMKLNAPKFGWVRTVHDEPWHWEYNLEKAEWSVAEGTYMARGVIDDFA